jgi:hypothetical protein
MAYAAAGLAYWRMARAADCLVLAGQLATIANRVGLAFSRRPPAGCDLRLSLHVHSASLSRSIARAARSRVAFSQHGGLTNVLAEIQASEEGY